MKIRIGFISNSSSSSFICNICGENVTGFDMSLEEAEMYSCEHGHIFCTSHTLFPEEVDKMIWEADDPVSIEESLAEKYCPLCQFQEITWFDLAKYLLINVGKSREEVLTEIKSKYKSFNDFNEDIRMA